jgi:CRP-like cAMP-binding protein
MRSEDPHRKNGILASLEAEEVEELRPNLETVELERMSVIYETGTRIEHVYFPHNAIVSLICIMRDGRMAETGTVGREGFTGSEIILSADSTSTSHCVAQVAGSASRLPSGALRALIETRPHARNLLMAYTRALFAQVLQSVACNATHSVEERSARWLLMTHDRAETDSFELTQEFLAEMLGVRRTSVNIVSRLFQKAGLIRYSRGVITILDRKGLESISCECYGLVRAVFEQFLPRPGLKH